MTTYGHTGLYSGEGGGAKVNFPQAPGLGEPKVYFYLDTKL
jgi:hypothetical protein